MNNITRKILVCMLAMLIFFCPSGIALMQATAHTSPSLPDWIPDDAPEPAPGSEIGIVNFLIDEDGTVIVVNEWETVPYETVTGNHGSAAIYWVNNWQVFWCATSIAGGYASFTGTVFVDTVARSYFVGGIGQNGSVSGNVAVESKKGFTNVAYLSGVMVDADGISFTLPGVQSARYY